MGYVCLVSCYNFLPSYLPCCILPSTHLVLVLLGIPSLHLCAFFGNVLFLSCFYWCNVICHVISMDIQSYRQYAYFVNMHANELTCTCRQMQRQPTTDARPLAYNNQKACLPMRKPRGGAHYVMLDSHLLPQAKLMGIYRGGGFIRERGSVLYLGMAQECWDFAKLAIA